VSRTSTVYLLHFARPIGHAQHYMGSTSDLEQRLADHAAGGSRGGRLPQVFAEAGIAFELARTWPGGRLRERQLKRQGGHARKCPVCIAANEPPRAHGARRAAEVLGRV
jgi:hypothetical protein